MYKRAQLAERIGNVCAHSFIHQVAGAIIHYQTQKKNCIVIHRIYDIILYIYIYVQAGSALAESIGIMSAFGKTLINKFIHLFAWYVS